jgi:hypothetical protein
LASSADTRADMQGFLFEGQLSDLVQGVRDIYSCSSGLVEALRQADGGYRSKKGGRPKSILSPGLPGFHLIAFNVNVTVMRAGGKLTLNETNKDSRESGSIWQFFDLLRPKFADGVIPYNPGVGEMKGLRQQAKEALGQ